MWKQDSNSHSEEGNNNRQKSITEDKGKGKEKEKESKSRSPMQWAKKKFTSAPTQRKAKNKGKEKEQDRSKSEMTRRANTGTTSSSESNEDLSDFSLKMKDINPRGTDLYRRTHCFMQLAPCVIAQLESWRNTFLRTDGVDMLMRLEIDNELTQALDNLDKSITKLLDDYFHPLYSEYRVQKSSQNSPVSLEEHKTIVQYLREKAIDNIMAPDFVKLEEIYGIGIVSNDILTDEEQIDEDQIKVNNIVKSCVQQINILNANDRMPKALCLMATCSRFFREREKITSYIALLETIENKAINMQKLKCLKPNFSNQNNGGLVKFISIEKIIKKFTTAGAGQESLILKQILKKMLELNIPRFGKGDNLIYIPEVRVKNLLDQVELGRKETPLICRQINLEIAQLITPKELPFVSKLTEIKSLEDVIAFYIQVGQNIKAQCLFMAFHQRSVDFPINLSICGSKNLMKTIHLFTLLDLDQDYQEETLMLSCLAERIIIEIVNNKSLLVSARERSVNANTISNNNNQTQTTTTTIITASPATTSTLAKVGAFKTNKTENEYKGNVSGEATSNEVNESTSSSSISAGSENDDSSSSHVP